MPPPGGPEPTGSSGSLARSGAPLYEGESCEVVHQFGSSTTARRWWSRGSSSPSWRSRPCPSSVDALSDKFELPGRESTDAANAIYNEFGTGGPSVNGPLIGVVQLPEGTTIESPGIGKEVGDAFAKIAGTIPDARFGRLRHDRQQGLRLGGRPHDLSVMWYPPSTTVAFEPAKEAQARRRGGRQDDDRRGRAGPHHGLRPLATGEGEESEGPSVLVETLLGGVGALVVLLFVFGSLMAFVPLLMAAASPSPPPSSCSGRSRRSPTCRWSCSS